MTHANHLPGLDALLLDPEEAANGFSALGSESRLMLIRILVRAGPEGMNVGALREAAGAPASTLSHHLRFLTQSGLVEQERRGRQIICRADFERVRALAAYLTRECCADAEAPGVSAQGTAS